MLLSQLIDCSRELEIEFCETTCTVSRQRKRYFVPADVDVGVVVVLFGKKSNGVHETHGSYKIGTLNQLSEFLPLSSPALQFAQLRGDLGFIKKLS